MNSLTSAPTTASELVIFKDVIIYSDIPCNKIILLISNLFKEYILIIFLYLFRIILAPDNVFTKIGIKSY